MPLRPSPVSVVCVLVAACAGPSRPVTLAGTEESTEGTGDGREMTTSTGEASTETTAPGTSGEEEDEQGLTSFVPPPQETCGDELEPDLGTRCGMCDPWLDDCPLGEKCTAYAFTPESSWDANKCVDVAGDDQPGEACQAIGADPGFDGQDTCAAGSMCWGVDPISLQGSCVAFCPGQPQDPMCPGSTVCAVLGEGALPVCVATCDPLAGESACSEPGRICVFAGDSEFVCMPDRSGAAGGYASPCEALDSCHAGLMCAPADVVPGCEDDACCTELCDLEDAQGDGQCSGADQGQVCVPFFELQPPPGYEHVGVCAA